MKLSRHHADAISLVFGLAFLGAAGLWLINQLVSLRPAAIGWIVAGGLLSLGAVGLVHTIAAGSRRS